MLAGATTSGVIAHETPTSPSVDNTVTRIELVADGSARWTVTIRTRLDAPTEVEDDEAVQTRFRENTSRFIDPFRSRLSSVGAGAAETAGRPMAASGFTAETHIQEVPRRWEIVEYGFS